MSDDLASLPWDQITRTPDSIPWSAMRRFADALVTDRRLAPRLMESYDRAYETLSDETGCADFYVAGIFALAAPRLDEERRKEIGSLLVERLVRAGQDDADFSLEVLMAAAGTMGPVILPAVLDAIAADPDARGAWFHLWGLTVLAAGTEDRDLGGRVVRTCVHVLEQADRGEIDLDSAGHAATTLAILKHAEHTELIRRLADHFSPSPWPNEYANALDILENRTSYDPQPEMWDQPVEEWLTPRCRMAMEAGLDPSDPEFSGILSKRESGESAGVLADNRPRQDAQAEEPPIPIVERRVKTARNAPCPCGSGRKYKKCHGRDQPASVN